VKHALNPDKPFMQVHYLKVGCVWGKEGRECKRKEGEEGNKELQKKT